MVKSVVKHIFDCFFLFPNRPKFTRLKGFRRLASLNVRNAVYAPKPPALHPDLFCFCDLGIYRILCGRCLIVTRSGEKEPKLPYVRLCCGSSEKARMRPSTLPNHPRCTRIHPAFAGGVREQVFSVGRPVSGKGTHIFVPCVPNGAIIPRGSGDVKLAFFRTWLSGRIRERSAIC